MSVPALQIVRSGKTSWVHGTCEECGADITRPLYNWQKRERHYCSLRCAGRAKQAENARRPRILSTRTCHFCSATIYRPESQFVEGRDRHFCNPTCFAHWHAGRDPLDAFLHELTNERISEIESLRDDKRLLERLVAALTARKSAL